MKRFQESKQDLINATNRLKEALLEEETDLKKDFIYQIEKLVEKL